jgi:hypothetical protein
MEGYEDATDESLWSYKVLPAATVEKLENFMINLRT